MKRHQFITLLGGAAAAWPLAARAQQGERVRRIGVLMNSTATDATWQSYVAGFVEALRQLGWSEGQTCGLIFAGMPAMPLSRASTRRS